MASSRRDHEHALLPWPSSTDRQVLPLAVIYGANASGKSSILDALNMMRRHIRFSHTKEDPSEPIRRSPFLLDPKSKNESTHFECDFVDGGQRFTYGFEISDEVVLKEWLHAFPRGRRQMLFERTKQKFKFSRLLSGEKKVISRLTRPNSLFVSTGAQNDHETLTRVRKYFTSWRGDLQTLVTNKLVTRRLGKKDIDLRVLEFLKELGTGVVEHRRESRKIAKHLQPFSRELVELINKQVKESTKVQLTAEELLEETIIELGHKALNGETVFFPLNLESDGTRRLLALLHEVFAALDAGQVLVVDELNASLHTYACIQIINLFLSRKTNPKGAQLIATTHDTNLLSLKHLRRDEIWLADKDEYGRTDLVSLIEYQTRRTDNIERGYLQGRFGGVPPKLFAED